MAPWLGMLWKPADWNICEQRSPCDLFKHLPGLTAVATCDDFRHGFPGILFVAPLPQNTSSLFALGEFEAVLGENQCHLQGEEDH